MAKMLQVNVVGLDYVNNMVNHEPSLFSQFNGSLPTVVVLPPKVQFM
jgi:hypothetical protein